MVLVLIEGLSMRGNVAHKTYRDKKNPKQKTGIKQLYTLNQS